MNLAALSSGRFARTGSSKMRCCLLFKPDRNEACGEMQSRANLPMLANLVFHKKKRLPLLKVA